MSFLFSLIDHIVIEEKKLREVLLNTFEEKPHTSERPEDYTTYVIKVRRKVLDRNTDGPATNFMKGIIAFLTGNKEPVFAIPPQS